MSASWDRNSLADLTLTNDMEAVRAQFANNREVMEKLEKWLEVRESWLSKANATSDLLFIKQDGTALHHSYRYRT